MPIGEPPRGNVGDWSELYTLANLLVTGGGYSADENNDRIESIYYKVLKALIASTDSDPALCYEIRNNTIVIYENDLPVKTISRSDLKRRTETFFRDLKMVLTFGTLN